jgi:hypothetical protein
VCVFIYLVFGKRNNTYQIKNLCKFGIKRVQYTNDLSCLNRPVYLTNIEQQTKVRLIPLEGEIQKSFVSCRISDVTSAMATMCTTVNIIAKWQIHPRK